MQLRPGDQINHYTLMKQLGEGGQGSVWEVLDPRDGGVVRALKIIALAETGPSSFDRARREARILAAASHPALVTCHSFFEERDGLVGLLMDRVSGSSLADAIDERRLDRARSLAVLGHLADVLAYVHGEGLVHRDVKPENLLLTDGFWENPTRPGSVKLVDFGIAASTGKDVTLTAPGTVIGTLPYLAPELVDPATWGKSEGPHRDIFAFGVLAYRLLVGKHPTKLGFDAAMIDYARAYKAAEAGLLPWPPTGIEGSWGAVVSACLALRPSDRPADGGALIEMVHAGVSIKTERVSRASSTTEPYAPSPATTEPMEPVAAVKTAPAQVKTIPAAPSPLAMGAPAPRPRRWIWAALALVGLGAAGGAAAQAYLGHTAPAAPTFTPDPRTPAPPTAAVTPVSGSPCRNPTLHFDARDTHFACPPCEGDAPRLPPREWRMRIHGVTPKEPFLRDDLPKKICAQVAGSSPICVPFVALPDRAGAKTLPVTSSDIDGGHVYFSIREADNSIVAKGFGHRRPGVGHFLESGLCAGFVLVIDDPSVTITVFLDER